MLETLAFISENTMTQYSKLIRLWWLFCKWRQINIESYSTLNIYCLAISFLSSDEVSSHLLVKRYFKGATILKHNIHVMTLFETHFQLLLHLALYLHEDLSLELVSRKLTLLDLTTAPRLQTLRLFVFLILFVQTPWLLRFQVSLRLLGLANLNPCSGSVLSWTDQSLRSFSNKILHRLNTWAP